MTGASASWTNAAKKVDASSRYWDEAYNALTGSRGTYIQGWDITAAVYTASYPSNASDKTVYFVG